jgi:hypothetical protein
MEGKGRGVTPIAHTHTQYEHGGQGTLFIPVSVLAVRRDVGPFNSHLWPL